VIEGCRRKLDRGEAKNRMHYRKDFLGGKGGGRMGSNTEQKPKKKDLEG